MLYINKITSHHTIDFAAEELKKYLRMMMPKVPDVKISYAPEAKDGFRLGLMQDFGLDLSDVKDPSLDDTVYIETREDGGIIAGSNERSVLLAVYEYLRQNGCRWLYPGIDGEYIPMKAIKPVTYRHVASSRRRGPVIEGAVSQKTFLELIDYLPKVGLNLFVSQFFLPSFFFDRYYSKLYNDISATYPKEKVTNDNVLQWKTAAETEIAKRSLQYHDTGHGWTAEPFGFDTSTAWCPIDTEGITEESQKYFALYKGERKLYNRTPLATQFCMSNATARKIVVDYIADYAENHPYVDYLHITLGDAMNNHCECEECVKKRISDFYVILLNELDKACTKKGIKTRFVFSIYHDTMWAPLTERIENPDRFVMQLAPICRSYTRALSGNPLPEIPPFERNKIKGAKTLDDFIPFYNDWKARVFSGETQVFEYHFWRHQHFDLSHIYLAKRVFEDVEVYHSLDVTGMVACGSLRSFFPNGFAYYVYARKLFDLSLTYDELKEDYFSCAYGEDWQKVYAYLEEIYNVFGFGFLEGEDTKDATISPYYDPDRAELLSKAKDVTPTGIELSKALSSSSVRPQVVSAKLLAYHAEYCNLLAEVLILKARGEEDEAIALYDKTVRTYMANAESFLEPYHDFYQAFQRIHWLLEEKGSALQIN